MKRHAHPATPTRRQHSPSRTMPRRWPSPMTSRCGQISTTAASSTMVSDQPSFAGTDGSSSAPKGLTANKRSLRSSTLSPMSRCSSIWSISVAADCRHSTSHGIRESSSGSGLAKAMPEKPGSTFHWTGPFYRWNRTCIDCHSTDPRANFQPESSEYKSSYVATSIGCQSCHGAGAKHVAWAEGKTRGCHSVRGSGLRSVEGRCGRLFCLSLETYQAR